MINNIENTLKAMLKKFPDYTEQKLEFKKEYPSLYGTIEYLEMKVEGMKEQEFIINNNVDNYHLKKHFGLLTEEEINRQYEVYRISAKQCGISYELYIEMQKRNTKFLADVDVLLTYDYPYHLAYKIGNSIDDSEFIECSLYVNDIYKIINIFLEIRKKVHDV